MKKLLAFLCALALLAGVLPAALADASSVDLAGYVDLNTLKVTVIPHIWLIGSAFSWGWTLADAQEMTYTGDGAFTWSGNMFAGIFKFLVVPDEWWGYWRDASAAEYWTATENGEGDVQFEVAAAGEYTLGFNVLTKVVSLANKAQ